MIHLVDFYAEETASLRNRYDHQIFPAESDQERQPDGKEPFRFHQGGLRVALNHQHQSRGKRRTLIRP
jgi:hypothetical protein